MSKLNQILEKWLPNTLITTEWLEKTGVSRQLANSYIKSGWLERFGSGAYKRPHEEINWAGGIYTLQNLSDLSVHVGGITALEVQGYAHYIRKGAPQKVTLWKTPEVRLPAWFINHEWKVDLQVRSVNLFDEGSLKLTEKDIEGLSVYLSVPEQAILEYLYDMPKFEGFDEAGYIMEGLTSLRPAVLQTLLERCRSIKVKRLFLYLADFYAHPWFKRLDLSNIDLGSGKREIIKGGMLDKKYQIVVPNVSREDR